MSHPTREGADEAPFFCKINIINLKKVFDIPPNEWYNNTNEREKTRRETQ